jgi:hypothetical protein
VQQQGGQGAGGLQGSGPSLIPDFTIGGTVSGLTNGALTLTNTIDRENLPIFANGLFTFKTTVANGGAYDVIISSQPRAQVCTITNNSGNVSDANVTNVTVECSGGATGL